MRLSQAMPDSTLLYSARHSRTLPNTVTVLPVCPPRHLICYLLSLLVHFSPTHVCRFNRIYTETKTYFAFFSFIFINVIRLSKRSGDLPKAAHIYQEDLLCSSINPSSPLWKPYWVFALAAWLLSFVQPFTTLLVNHSFYISFLNLKWSDLTLIYLPKKHVCHHSWSSPHYFTPCSAVPYL